MTNEQTESRLGIQPAQTPPVRRPDLVHPHEAVDVVHGTPEQLLEVRLQLMHGANFNDPQRFRTPTYQGMKYSA